MTSHLLLSFTLVLFVANHFVLTDQQRIYCLIKTFGQNLATKALTVHETWARRCDKHTFLTATNLTKWNMSSLPIMNLADVNDNYLELSIKVFDAINLILQEHQPYDFDWLLIADDDTYVIMEHLRFLLDSSSEPRVFGHLFKPKTGLRGHLSGGAGYVMNTAALQRMLPNLQTTCASWYLPGAEDVHMSRCLQHLNVTLDGAIDVDQHHRFYPLSFLDMYERSFPQWFSDYNALTSRDGFDCCSSQSVTFHYIPTESMHLIEWARYVHDNE